MTHDIAGSALRFGLGAFALTVLSLGCGDRNWVTAEDEAAGVSAAFPEEPLRTSEAIDTPAGTLTTRTMSWPDTTGFKNGVRFEITTSSFPLETVDEGLRRRVLDGARDGILATTGGRLLDEGVLEVESVPGRRVRVSTDEDSVVLTAWLFVYDRQMIQALAFAENKTAASHRVERFYQSFRFEPLRP